MNEERIAAARAEMAQRGVDALVVTVGSDLPYLIGYRAMENERITALVIPADGDPTLVVPALEKARVDSDVETVAWGETEDPVGIIAYRCWRRCRRGCPRQPDLGGVPSWTPGAAAGERPSRAPSR